MSKLLEIGTPYLLNPGHSVFLKCEADEGDSIRWSVRAPAAVAAYILDADGREQCRRGEEWEWYQGHDYRKRYDEVFDVPETGDWYLLIMNANGDEPIPVVFDIDVE